jgi:hypothetical protein
MKRRLLKMAAVTGLVLPAAAQAQDLTKPAPVPPSLPWKVNCHGLASVPLTADALQALPLRLVTNLTCDQGLAVVSDPDGYTVNVRTADGKTGYIASMYLMKAPPAKPAPHVEPTSASTNNGVARWRPGAKGCDEFTKNGVAVESLTANGVTVQVSLADTGSKLRADVAVGNFGNMHVYVNPVGITLESKGAHAKSLAYRDPAQLAKESQRGAGNSAAVNADFRSAEFSPVFASAYAVERKPVEDLSRPVSQTASVPDQFSALALKKGTLKPEGRTWGAVWFERDDSSNQYVMRVPIDNQIFEFPLSLDTAFSLNDPSNP